MASSVVAELEAGLQAMLSLKPPGVSGSRIANITTLCVANVQVSSPPTSTSTSTNTTGIPTWEPGLQLDFELTGIPASRSTNPSSSRSSSPTLKRPPAHTSWEYSTS